MKKISALIPPQIEAFLAVAKHGTVHAAGMASHISQTAMTQRIKNLEQKLGTTLFTRSREGMELTAEGEKLLRYAHTVLDYGNETLKTMIAAGYDSIQRVQISGPSSLMISRVIPQCTPLMQSFPHLYINFDINDGDLSTALRQGASQFVIVPPEQLKQDMDSKVLKPEEYQLVCSQQWQGRLLKQLLNSERIIDFDETDVMTFNYLRSFDLLHYANNERLFVNRTESLSKLLIEGYGYGVLTKEFSESYLQNGELITLNEGRTFHHQLVIAWYQRPAPPPYFSAIIDAIT